MPIHIFVDTNVYLAFYAYNNDDIEQLKIIVELAKADKIKLHIPEQVVREFYRRREFKIAESLRNFKSQLTISSLPRYMTGYDEANSYQSARDALKKAHSDMMLKATDEANKLELAADKLFTEIVEASNLIATTDDIIKSATKRKVFGDPPGKGESHGDQINWESLLSGVPKGTDLHIVSKDGDYASPLDTTSAHNFLQSDWSASKDSKLYLHEELRPFLKSQFPDITLAVNVEKHAAIEQLETSSSFSTTHFSVAKLSIIKDSLTWSDATRLLDAGLANSQINWIGKDSDVSSFYGYLMTTFASKIAPERMELLKALFSKTKTED